MAWVWDLCHKSQVPHWKRLWVDTHLTRVKHEHLFWNTEKSMKKRKQLRPRADHHPTHPHSHSTQTLQLMRWYHGPVGLCLFYLSSFSLNPDNFSASTVSFDHLMHWAYFLSFAPQPGPKSPAVPYSYTRRQSLTGSPYCCSTALKLLLCQLRVLADSISPLMGSAAYLFREEGTSTHLAQGVLVGGITHLTRRNPLMSATGWPN